MTINAHTDPETGLRYYDWRGDQLPSVTSVRRLIGMPFNLHNWTLSQVIDRAITDHNLIGEMMKRPKRPRERAYETNVLREVRKHLRAAATEERDLAGDKGQRAHDAIASGLAPHEVPADIFGQVVQFNDFMHVMRPRILWRERQVWNLTYGYAGTADALMMLPSGLVFVVDYKTSRGVYLDHAIQVIGYGMGEFVGENDTVDAEATAQLKSAHGLAILHLGEYQWEWLEVRADPVLFQGFLGALTFAKFLSANMNSIDPVIISKRTGGTLVPALAQGLKLQQGQKEQPSNGTIVHP